MEQMEGVRIVFWWAKEEYKNSRQGRMQGGGRVCDL